MRDWRRWIPILVLATMMVQGLAQPRLERLADQLAEQAEDLVGDSYNGFRTRDRGTRADVEVLYLVYQFSASATLFRRMVHDRRPESELRDALAILGDQARGAERYGFGRRQWQGIRRTMDDIARNLGEGGSRPPDRPPARVVTGRLRWEGVVDGEIQIYVTGGEAEVRIISGAPAYNVTANFTSPLPQRKLVVELNKMKGRGKVDILQQPSPDNQFTAVVRIRDNKGGTGDYEFELTW